MALVFVYGTLKAGEPNHHWLTDPRNGRARLLGRARTVDTFPLVIASRYNIPYLLRAPGVGEHVEGEVYEVDERMLAQLDVLEDHPKYYEREIRRVTLTPQAGEATPLTPASETTPPTAASEATVDAWVYLLPSFKPAMLDLPRLKSYSASGPHGLAYMPRYARPKPGPEYWVDVKDGVAQGPPTGENVTTSATEMT
ncbi:putative gamma-glutamylcyclotransferase CG2811 [Hyalella azteca]|uniref:Gamma-glutamylcyclotransferase family protein n=1 Tax=Hyalella azteca TaxID=294128 RepID=A0A8B7P6I4_HYAAZ|nr:putative gamma-glutamylcyclotransferase CG2811 [Hyalella azteca]